MVGVQPDARGDATSSVEAVNVWRAVCISVQSTSPDVLALDGSGGGSTGSLCVDQRCRSRK